MPVSIPREQAVVKKYFLFLQTGKMNAIDSRLANPYLHAQSPCSVSLKVSLNDVHVLLNIILN